MLSTPKGYQFAVTDAGFHKYPRNNLALVLSDTPATAAGVFTKNRFCAAPVIVGKEILEGKPAVRGIMINTGQANACTGEQGIQNCRTTISLLAKALNIDSKDILPASTGVIGQQFDFNKSEMAVPLLLANFGKNNATDFADAILTTDAFHKISSRKINLVGGDVSLLGMAKGAGMICPNMATMLAVVLCDVQIDADLWQSLFRQAVDQSFNRVSVDGDTSTNDTVYGLANGASGISATAEDTSILLEALTDVLSELAYLLVKDGEGASKVLHISVVGAKNNADAELVARTIGHSPLVKTAMYGRDANWGRIVAAIGRSGAEFNPNDVTVSLCGYKIFEKGQPVDFDFDPVLEPLLKAVDIAIDVRLGEGQGQYIFKASDLGHAYIDCNASSRS